MANEFDFIVVGGGTAGCLLASRLSNSPAHPTVLLLEAGGDGLPIDHRAPYKRFQNAFVLPDFDHGYATVPQANLDGRELPYQRGKGLGGSTAINFLVYTRGPAADWDRWAELVDNDDWAWNKTKERFQKIETFDDQIMVGDRDYAAPQRKDHGYTGGLPICAPALEDDVRYTIEAGVEIGLPINLDHNSGNVMGVSAAQLSYSHGVRSTSEQAFLHTRPENLTVWTSSKVKKIMFRNKTAVGVEDMSGRRAFANKEIILTGGAIDSPKLLLLSGVGPAKELEKIGIPVIHDLIGVGKHARDHLQFEFALDVDKNSDALKEWKSSHSGPYADLFSSSGLIFGKTESTNDSAAFRALPAETQAFLRRPDVPNWEIAFAGPLIPPSFEMTSDCSFSNNITVQLNSVSEGEVTLRSNDPTEPPLIDPKFLSNDYDKEILIAAVRAEMLLMQTKTMQNHFIRPIVAPKGDSDEEILAFIRATAGPLWHFSSTTKMGRSEDKTAVVDSQLRVSGLKNLRVADVGVAPFSPNSHTQATAYLIGQAAADFIMEEYHLEVTV